MAHHPADPITITRERPDSPAAMALIDELEAVLQPLYPASSRHGYSVEKLIAQNVAFFIIWAGSQPAGCGGVQLYGQAYGEIKRMFTRPAFRGLGLAKRMLAHLEEHCRAQGVYRLRLETGIHQLEAIGLYEQVGYCKIGPFGEYILDPLSVFYEKLIQPA